MNRRDFIKKAGATTALATWTVTCQYEENEHDPKGEKGEVGETGWKRWDYRVYCYERGQGEWTFSQNIKGSFAYQREYMTLEEDTFKYSGWMDQGKLHFSCFDDASTFVDCHVRTKDDTNLIDSIYDIYFVKRTLDVADGADTIEEVWRETEIKVAHYWFNGDTGRTIVWEQDGFNQETGQGLTNWNQVECS